MTRLNEMKLKQSLTFGFNMAVKVLPTFEQNIYYFLITNFNSAYCMNDVHTFMNYNNIKNIYHHYILTYTHISAILYYF